MVPFTPTYEVKNKESIQIRLLIYWGKEHSVRLVADFGNYCEMRLIHRLEITAESESEWWIWYEPFCDETYINTIKRVELKIFAPNIFFQHFSLRALSTSFEMCVLMTFNTNIRIWRIILRENVTKIQRQWNIKRECAEHMSRFYSEIHSNASERLWLIKRTDCRICEMIRTSYELIEYIFISISSLTVDGCDVNLFFIISNQSLSCVRRTGNTFLQKVLMKWKNHKSLKQIRYFIQQRTDVIYLSEATCVFIPMKSKREWSVFEITTNHQHDSTSWIVETKSFPAAKINFLFGSAINTFNCLLSNCICEYTKRGFLCVILQQTKQLLSYDSFNFGICKSH